MYFYLICLMVNVPVAAMDCRINLVLLVLCLFQDCYGERCRSYRESDVNEDCEKLGIDNGIVCYETLQWDTNRNPARIRCQNGYTLKTAYGINFLLCFQPSKDNYKHQWTDPTDSFTCLSDDTNKDSSSNADASKGDANNRTPVESTTNKHDAIEDATTTHGHDDGDPFAIYIAVPLVVVVCIGIGAFGIWMFVFRRIIKCPIKTNLCFKANTESAQSQQGQSSEIVDVSAACEIAAVNRESGIYHCINDADVVVDVHVVPAIDEEKCEYNTLHEHLNIRSNAPNDLPSQVNVYAHIAYSPSDTNATTDTYSHINETKVSNNYSRSHYDKIAINGEFNKSDSGKNEESVYNHTNTRRIAQAGGVSVFDTYAHVDNGQELTDDDIDSD